MWTPPKTWVAGELVTAAAMNVHVRDNEIDLNARVDAAYARFIYEVVSVGSPAVAGFPVLYTYTLPASALAATMKSIHFRAAGFFQPNTNGKGLQLSVGGTTICQNGPAVYNGGGWFVELYLSASSASAQQAVGFFLTTPSNNGPVGKVNLSLSSAAPIAISVHANSSVPQLNDVVYTNTWLQYLN